MARADRGTDTLPPHLHSSYQQAGPHPWPLQPSADQVPPPIACACLLMARALLQTLALARIHRVLVVAERYFALLFSPVVWFAIVPPCVPSHPCVDRTKWRR